MIDAWTGVNGENIDREGTLAWGIRGFAYPKGYATNMLSLIQGEGKCLMQMIRCGKLTLITDPNVY